MDFKLLGSILLIMGTSIGAGMLALPIATASLGFGGALGLLFASWFVMTAGAFLILEVNLWLNERSHIISMAKATIGPLGQLMTWASYLLLLYALLCAYIAGGADLFHHLLNATGLMTFSKTTATLLFVLLLGGIVYCGIHVVDYANRLLMFVKLGAYVIVIALLAPFVSKQQLFFSHFSGDFIGFKTAVFVTITSFGFATLVPSLRIHFAGDLKKLKKVILIGSLLPLVCYVLWIAAIMGVVSFTGDQGLFAMSHSDHTTSDLVYALDHAVHYGSVIFCVKVFTSICMVTSFLGVALCLADFLADGLQVEKRGWHNLFIHLLTFLPPVLVVLFVPHVFIKALAYGGIYSVILLILLPAWMAWSGRYRRGLAKGYRVPGGKALLSILIVLSCVLILYFI